MLVTLCTYQVRKGVGRGRGWWAARYLETTAPWPAFVAPNHFSSIHIVNHCTKLRIDVTLGPEILHEDEQKTLRTEITRYEGHFIHFSEHIESRSINKYYTHRFDKHPRSSRLFSMNWCFTLSIIYMHARIGVINGYLALESTLFFFLFSCAYFYAISKCNGNMSKEKIQKFLFKYLKMILFRLNIYVLI